MIKFLCSEFIRRLFCLYGDLMVKMGLFFFLLISLLFLPIDTESVICVSGLIVFSTLLYLSKDFFQKETAIMGSFLWNVFYIELRFVEKFLLYLQKWYYIPTFLRIGYMEMWFLSIAFLLFNVSKINNMFNIIYFNFLINYKLRNYLLLEYNIEKSFLYNVYNKVVYKLGY